MHGLVTKSTSIRFLGSISRGGPYGDSYDYTRLLQKCPNTEFLTRIHAQVITSCLHHNLFLAAKLISHYIHYGKIEIARRVFDSLPKRDILLWNVIIRGYANLGPFENSIETYDQMRSSGVAPNQYTCPFVLKACAALGSGREGRKIHGHILKLGLESNLFVGNALVAFYAKCGKTRTARRVFDEIRKKDPVSWNSMIAGYSQNECFHDALELFHTMLKSSSLNMLDRVTLVTILPVCAQLAAVEEGMWIHSYIIKSAMEVDAVLGSCLVGIYARCGRLVIARDVFDRVLERNIVVWNAMIGGFGIHGHADQALDLFEQMVQAGIYPDDISISCILSACSHGGMVKRGLEIFKRMGEYGVERSEGHYACVVDILGRSGRLNEAVTFIETMPMDAGKDVWGALLGACRIHNNIELAEKAAQKLFVLDPENAGRYVLLAKMYEDARQWDDVARVRKMMKERKVRKPLGYSEIEVDHVVHSFGVEDVSHPMTVQIFETLERLGAAVEEVME